MSIRDKFQSTVLIVKSGVYESDVDRDGYVVMVFGCIRVWSM